jgi:O-antigen ligase
MSDQNIHRDSNKFLVLATAYLLMLSGAILFAFAAIPLAGLLLLLVAGVVSISSFLQPLASLRITIVLAGTTGWLLTTVLRNGISPVLIVVAAFLFGYFLRQYRLGGTIPTKFGIGPLMLIAVIASISLVTVYFKVTALQLVPGAGYIDIAANPLGLSGHGLFQLSFFATFNYMLWPGIYLAALLLWKEKDFSKTIMQAFMAIVILNFTAIIIQYFFIHGLFAPNGILTDGRGNGLMSFCNAFANSTVLLLIFLPFWWKKGYLSRFWHYALGSMLLVNLYISGGRAAWVLVFLAAIAYAILHLTKQSKKERVKTVLVGLLVIGLAVSALLITETIFSEKESMLVKRIEVLLDEDIAEYFMFLRGEMWGYASHIITQSPVSGVGAGTFFSELSISSALQGIPSWFIDNALNQYLNIAAELGLFAILLFVFFIARVLILLGNNWKERSELNRLALIFFVLFLLSSILGPHISDAETMFFFWFFAGLIVARFGSQPPVAAEIEPNRKLVTAANITIVLFVIAGSFFHAASSNAFTSWQQLRWHVESGIYPAEANGMQWTETSAIKFIPPRKNSIMKITWRLGEDSSPSAPRYLRLGLNGIEVAKQKVVDNDWHTSYFWLGKEKRAGHALGINVSRPFIPGNEDKRELGLYIRSIKYQNRIAKYKAGFHRLESDGDKNFYWTKGMALTPIPKDSKSASFWLRAGNADIGSRPLSVTIFQDDIEIESVTLKNDFWLEITVPLSGDKRHNYSSLRFEVDRTRISSDESNSTDNRSLGVAVTPIEWR